jgi:methyltransferase family protein
MNASHVSRRVLFALCLSLPASVFAQSQATQTFEPQVGQPGKDVVWVPTPQELVDKMLDMAKVTPQDYLIDLGSGDGRTVITAAKRGLRAHGIEYNPDMVELSKRAAAKEGMEARATFAKADLFESDFSKATVISMFLLPSINLQLRPKILDLKPGTRIVSNTFDMEEWQPDEKSTLINCAQWCTALMWIVPAKVEGKWQTPQGTLMLMQQFQRVSGMLGSTSITNGALKGEQLTFAAGGSEYTVRANGKDTLEGQVTTGGRTSNFTATRIGG